MTDPATEATRREAAARAAIRTAYGTPQAEYGVTLFVTHHLAELEPDYWRGQLGDDAPPPERILDLLELRGHWSDDDDDDGLEVFDFTLPDDVTNYVISVRFDEAGEIAEVSMES